MTLGAGGIGQRAEQVENGPELQFSAGGLRVFHGGVQGLREEKADADLLNGARHFLGRGGDVDTELFEDIGAAARSGVGAIAMLGNAGAGAGGDKRGEGGDVESDRVTAAGSAGVEKRLAVQARLDGSHFIAHGANETN